RAERPPHRRRSRRDGHPREPRRGRLRHQPVVGVQLARFPLPAPGNERAMRISAVGVIYLVVGAVVAATHDYFENIDTLKRFLSAVLAVVLWPLILIGIDFHVHALPRPRPVSLS